MAPVPPSWLLLVALLWVQEPRSERTSTHEPLLAPGPFAVGFSSSWAFDEGRTYRTAFDEGRTYGAEKAARPVLVLAWYPARAPAAASAPMAHGRYFALPSEDPRLVHYAGALSSYARGVFVEQVLGKAESELDEAEKALLEAALAAPTSAREKATPAPGPFPLVVYHSGAGSSYEDNAALCEYLASHGFVVLGSAFPRADGSSFGIDGGRGSAEDVQALVRWARALAFVDGRRVALVGHSAGAQAMLKYAAQPGCVGDALVLLDTTQDYYGLGMPLHEALVREASEGRARLRQSLLVAAGPEALFALCDTLVEAERTYLTLPELGHDEYISQGLQRLERCLRQGVAEQVTRAPTVRAHYRALCEDVRAFLEAELGRTPGAFAARLAAAGRPWSPFEPSLVHLQRGASTVEAYDPERPTPPTPREFRRLLIENGAEVALAVLARFRAEEPRGPLYTSTMLAGSLLYELAQLGRHDEARLYYAFLQEIALPVLSVFEFLADIKTMQADGAGARAILNVARGIDPGHEGIARRLRELEPRGDREDRQDLGEPRR